MNSIGSITWWLVPSRHAVLSFSTTCPARLTLSRSLVMNLAAGRLDICLSTGLGFTCRLVWDLPAGWFGIYLPVKPRIGYNQPSQEYP